MIGTCILFDKEANHSAPCSLENPPAPTFLTGERIRGTVLINHILTEEPIFDTAQILLRGDVTSVVHLKADIYRRTEKPLLRMSCVKSRKNFERSSIQKAVTSQCTFFFEMPQSIMLPSMLDKRDMKRGFQQLPPSLRIVQAGSTKCLITTQGPTPGVCDVAYYIEARLFLKGHVVREAIREIMVMPVAEAPPPVEPGDLRNEYRLTASSPLGISWRRKHTMRVSISSSEPRPLVFESARVKNCGGTADCLPSTGLLLRLSARQMLTDENYEHIVKPEISGCDLTVTLEATTYFLPHEEHSVLSIAEARNTPFSVVKTTRFKTQKLKTRFSNWNRVKDSITVDFIDWEATAAVPAQLPSDAPRLPSFFSALVSRRYAFHVQAKLSYESGSCLHDRLRLKVPVQVIHVPVETEFDEREEVNLGDESEVPVYIP